MKVVKLGFGVLFGLYTLAQVAFLGVKLLGNERGPLAIELTSSLGIIALAAAITLALFASAFRKTPEQPAG